jgi:two-component system cell cycle response regulator CtrA
MRVLIVDLGVSRSWVSISLTLRSEGCVVDVASDEEAEPYVLDYSYDIIVAAAMETPIADITAFVRWLRYRSHVPLLVVGTQTVEAVVQALNWGADDCLRMPYHKDELAARVRAIVRRARGFGNPIVSSGHISVDLNRKRVCVRGTPLRLTAKEYLLIECCALRAGSPVSKAELLEHLYGSSGEADMKTIDVFVCKIRKKAKDLGADADCLATVWGTGYQFAAPAEPFAATA